MRAANPPSSAAPSTASRSAQHRRTPPRLSLFAPRRPLARGADRGLSRSSATRCARRPARPRSQRELSNIRTAADAAVQARADRSSRRSAPSGWSTRSTTASVVATAQAVARQFRGAIAPLMTPRADRRGDAGHVHRLGPAPADARRRRRSPAARRRWPRGWPRPAPPRRPSASAERHGQLRRSAAARRARAASVSRAADRGHGRHHRPLRQRLDAHLQADRVRARLRSRCSCASAAASSGIVADPAVARLAEPGWSRRRALADLDLDGMERLLTGRRIGMSLRHRRGCLRARAARPARRICPTSSACSPPSSSRRAGTPALFAALPHRGARELRPATSPRPRRAAGRELGARHPPRRPALAADRARREIEAATAEAVRSAFFAPLLAAGPGRCDHRRRRRPGDGGRGDAARRSRALPRRADAGASGGRAHARGRRRPNPEPRRFTHQGDPNQAYAVIGWSTFGGERAHPRAARARARRQHPRRRGCSIGCASRRARPIRPTPPISAADSFPDWGIFFAASEIRPERGRDLLPHRARDRRRSGRPSGPAGRVRRGRRTRWSAGSSGGWRPTAIGCDAMEDWDARSRATSSNVRTYLADYRALTPEDVRRGGRDMGRRPGRLVDAGSAR